MSRPFHGSHWFHGIEPPRFPRLWGDRRVDVAVIGGGITGITAALLCKQAGLTVAVLEARQLGAGVTGGTSAHLTAMPDARFVRLEENFGDRKAKQVWDTGVAAIDRIEAFTRDLGIDCDFQRVEGALYAAKPDHVDRIEQEAKAGRRMGVPFEVVDELALPYEVHRALRFTEGQARFHPIRYLYGLAKAVQGLNSEIFEDSRVLHVEPGDVCTITTEEGQVHAGHVIVATHSPIGAVLSVQTRIAAYRSYCIDVEVPDEAPDGLYWDTEEPYNYIRKGGPNRLIIGGRDHKTGHGHDLRARFDELEAWTAERFPGAKRTHGWSAQVFEPADGLPYIGSVPGAKNVTMATGYAGNGLTFGTAAAMLVTDLVVGRANGWSSLYDPARAKPVASAGHVVKENVDVAFRFLADRLSAADAQTLEDVPVGEGRLVRLDGKKLAVYRDPSGDVHVMSPVCTHLGCIVQWNDAETSWDCPCHGGRYDAYGEVLDGPPVRALGSPSRAALVWGPLPVEEEEGVVGLQPDSPPAK